MRARMGFVVLGVVLALSAVASASPIVWTGPTMTFTKADNADWTLAANQDRITDTTWLTRANTHGLFNIEQETQFTWDPDGLHSLSPLNTEWAYGHAADYASLTFGTWLALTNIHPPDMLNKDVVLHLVSDDIYIDYKLLSWTSGGGGGLSYERSTAAVVPEPVTMTLLGLGGIALLRRRKA